MHFKLEIYLPYMLKILFAPSPHFKVFKCLLRHCLKVVSALNRRSWRRWLRPTICRLCSITWHLHIILFPFHWHHYTAQQQQQHPVQSLAHKQFDQVLSRLPINQTKRTQSSNCWQTVIMTMQTLFSFWTKNSILLLSVLCSLHIPGL